MNALLDIQIRVQAQQAISQLRALQGQINQLNTGVAEGAGKSAGALGTLGAKIDSIASKTLSWGKNMQWTGQQMTMSFTLPLMLMGGLATKWALENEEAFTRVRKVYSGAEEDLDKLRVSFELLSSRFGVNQKEVIEIGEAWAAVGAEGVALAKNTRTTMEFMILSGLDAQAATEGLIKVQTAYRLSTEELTEAVAVMNMMENRTALSMGDLLDGIEKAGGAARLMGVDIRHLGAYLAALVPSTGSAAAAGNSLKTIFSRLFAPTPEAEEMLSIIGLTNTELGKQTWHAANGVERMEMLAGATRNMTDEQIAMMTSVVGTRYQYNRLITLLDDMTLKTGNYNKALEATADQQVTNDQKSKELSTFLSSQPQAFKMLTESIQNMMAKAIMPLLPAIAGVFKMVYNLVKAFTDLDPQTQKTIMGWLVLLAALGPIIRYVGAFAQLIGVLGKVFIGAGKAFIWFYQNIISGLINIAATAVKTFATMAWAGAKWVATAVAQSAQFVAAQVRAFGAVVAASAKATIIQLAQQAKLALGYIVGTARALAFMAAAWAAQTARHVATVAFQVLVWASGQAAMAAASIAAAAASAAAWLAANPYVLLIIAAIALVVAAIVALIVFWDTDFVDGIREGALAAGRFILKIPEYLGAVVEWFENGITAIVGWIWKLPEAIGKALMAALHIAQKIIEQLMEALSYINPFARHSPSLVDNVTAGVTEILKQYGRLSKVGTLLSGVQGAHENFNAVATPTLGDATQRKFATQRKNVAETAPSVLPAFDSHVKLITSLKNELPAIEAAVARQEDVTEAWSDSLKAANKELDVAEKILKNYKARLDAVEDQIAKANKAISDLASTGITGMRAMEDALFANEIAQKKLRLEILRIGKAYGSVDKLKDKFAELQGMLEKMRSEREELRQAGAGSDILQEYDDQIEALKKQEAAISASGEGISDLEKQLEALQVAAEEMELEKSITFDPQLRQIDQLVNGLNELPFDEIIKKIKEQQDQLVVLSAEQVIINAQVGMQTAEVERLTAARDRIQYQYELEKEKLEEIKGLYDQVRDAVSLLESDLANFQGALDEITSKASDMQNAFDEAIGEFSNIGDIVDQEAGSLDQFNEDLQAELDEALANIEEFDMFGPIKAKWEEFKIWWDGVWSTFTADFTRGLEFIGGEWEKLEDQFQAGWAEVTGWVYEQWLNLQNGWAIITGWISQRWTNITNIIGGAWARVTDEMKTKLAWLQIAFQLVGDGIRAAWDGVTGFIRDMWNKAWDQAEGKFNTFKNALSTIWDKIKEIFRGGANIAIGGVESLLNAALHLINNISGPLNKLKSLLPGGAGGPDIHFDDIHLTRAARGGITSGPYLAGEGRSAYPEYIIPTDPMFLSQARSLYSQLGRDLGMGGGSYAGSIPSSSMAGGGGVTVINVTGNLEFPNVSNGGDAKDFLDNLKSLGTS